MLLHLHQEVQRTLTNTISDDDQPGDMLSERERYTADEDKNDDDGIGAAPCLESTPAFPRAHGLQDQLPRIVNWHSLVKATSANPIPFGRIDSMVGCREESLFNCEQVLGDIDHMI